MTTLIGVSFDDKEDSKDIWGQARIGRLTLEITGQCEGQRNTIAIQLLLNTLPSCHKNYCLSCIASRGLQDPIKVLACIVLTSSMICIALSTNFDP